jgi:predicted outer membrane repeat protein
VGGFIIGNGTVFEGNTAKELGGAIYFYCQSHGKDLSKCSLNFTGKSEFRNNTAGIQGGAIKWNFYEPSNLMSSFFKYNKAGVYGDNVASVP